MEYISFVILHYKDYSVTDTCVRSILAMEQQERIRIVIVDNDIQKKEKDRQELLQKYQGNSRIKVLQIKENTKFTNILCHFVCWPCRAKSCFQSKFLPCPDIALHKKRYIKFR